MLFKIYDFRSDRSEKCFPFDSIMYDQYSVTTEPFYYKKNSQKHYANESLKVYSTGQNFCPKSGKFLNLVRSRTFLLSSGSFKIS